MEAYHAWNARMASATSISDEALTLLQNYTGLEPSQLSSHVQAIVPLLFLSFPPPGIPT